MGSSNYQLSSGELECVYKATGNQSNSIFIKQQKCHGRFSITSKITQRTLNAVQPVQLCAATDRLCIPNICIPMPKETLAVY